MVVKFSSLMDTTFVDLEAIEESIEIDLSPYFIDDDFDTALLQFDWSIQSYEGHELSIKLQFENPLYVSMYLN